MKLRKYKLENLIEAVKNSYSIAQVLQKLGIKVAGGNYYTVKKAIKFYKIDNSHFTGQGHLKGKTHTYKLRPLNEILVNGKYENTFALKKRLLKEGVKEHKCENCQLITWLEEKIPLELHHKDGNPLHNNLENLEILCPNCHALTHNYRGKNKKQNNNKN